LKRKKRSRLFERTLRNSKRLVEAQKAFINSKTSRQTTSWGNKHCTLQFALTPYNDVPLPGNIQAKDRSYPPVISLVSPYNAGDCTRRRRHEIDDVDARRKLDQFLTLAKSSTYNERQK